MLQHAIAQAVRCASVPFLGAMQDYEPYVLLARQFAPWYDERFRGFGRNKIQYIRYLRGGSRLACGLRKQESCWMLCPRRRRAARGALLAEFVHHL